MDTPVKKSPSLIQRPNYAEFNIQNSRHLNIYLEYQKLFKELDIDMNTHSQHNEMPQLDHGSQAIERLTEGAMPTSQASACPAPARESNARRVVSETRFSELYKIAETDIMDLYHRIVQGSATPLEAREAISALSGLISYFGLTGNFKTERRAIEVLRTFTDGALRGLYE
jgi:hypothetical protein